MVKTIKVNPMKVAIYIRYDIKDTDNWERQEKMVRDYCEKEGYKVIKIFRDIEEHSTYYSNIILDIIANCYKDEYMKIIMYDMYEISEYENKIYSLYNLLADHDIIVETIKNGVLGEDLLFGITMHENVRDKAKLNNPPIIDTPF